MIHQGFKKRVAYVRCYRELVAENMTMKQRIHRLVGDYNRVVKKLRKLEYEHEDVVETGDPFCKENPETVRVDSCVCWNCEYFCLRLKDRGKIVCKEGQKRNQQDNNVDD